MKYDDLSFKFLSLVIIAGVVLALAGPSESPNHNAAPAPAVSILTPAE